MSTKPPAKVLWWYERLADALIARPEATLMEIAKEFNCSLAWLSVVKNSDVFTEYWKRRSTEASKVLLGDLRAKACAAAEMSLDAINRKLELEADSLPLNALLEIADMSMKRFGYDNGGSRQAATVNLNFGLVKPEELAEARQRMRRIRLEALEASEEEDVA